MKDKYLVLVNRNHKFENGSDFNLVETDSRYMPNLLVEELTYKNYLELKKFMLENEFDIDLDDGYRSKERQEKIFNQIKLQKGEEYANKYVALPGYSEHETGLALDIGSWVNETFIYDFDNVAEFYELLANNAHNYGFILRYPQGKENITGYSYEPWHYRYVGINEAKEIYQKKLTLEEYLERK